MKIQKFMMIAVTTLLLVAAAQAAKDYITYTVKEGDTLSGIAKAYMKDSSKWGEILKANNLTNPNLIRPGMVLKIPKPLLKKQPPAKPRPAKASPSSKLPPDSTSAAPEPDTEPDTEADTEPDPAPAGSAPPSIAHVPSPPAQVRQSPMPSTPIGVKGFRGNVAYVKGDAVRIPEKGVEEHLKPGSKILPGDRLVTDASAFVTVSLPLQASITIGSDSRVKIDSMEENLALPVGKATIHLEQGRVRVRIGKRGLTVNLKCGSAAASITDGEIQMHFEDGITKYIEVFRGKATVKSGSSSVDVAAGKGVIITQGGMSAPKVLPTAPILLPHAFTTDEGSKAGVAWERSDKNISYRLEIAQDEEFAKTIYIAGYAGMTLDFAFFQQFPPGKYAFRLIAVSQDGLWGAPSNAMVFEQ